MSEQKFITKILHQPFNKKDPHGSLHMPVYENVAFEFETMEDIAAAFQGKKSAHVYSRSTNPTIEHFEQRIKAVTDATAVIALSSGMAAITNTIMAVAQAGDNIVTSRHLFGNTYSLFIKTLQTWGLETRFVDLTDMDEVQKNIDDKTKILFFETVTNPQLEIVDIKALSKITKANNVVLMGDTTATPPYIFKAKDFSVDIEIVSSTKFMSGGATTVGGLIIDNGTFQWDVFPAFVEEVKEFGDLALVHHLRRQVYRNMGACMSAHTAFMQSLGLETMPLRIDAACRNTYMLAEFLKTLPEVKDVHFPGLKDSKYYEIGRAQFGNKPGAILTFDLESKEKCFECLNKLKLIKRSTNLNDNRTLILHPASTIYCEYDEATRKEMGVRETLIRLSVGIEDIEDLKDDILGMLENK